MGEEMREIKLKAWDKKSKRWLDDGRWALDNKTGKPWYLEFGEMMDELEACGYDVVIVQYIGLRDKNGKEIYEDDIIEYEYGCSIHPARKFKGKVEWDNELTGFWPFIDIESECGCRVIRNSVERLGNWHENSELMERK